MTAESSSSYLISTLKGFGKAADEAESIVDVYNEVANNWAIDTAGIGEALQRSAASFYAANTDLEKSVALITATNTVVQDPASVGTLWKTLSARIRGAKTELQELDEETDEYTETTSKLRDLVKGLTGFDILKEDGKTFKDIYEIILGIGKEWENLTDIEQASLAEALAGKRNSNALLAVLNNLDTLEGAYKSALEAEGSAQKEQENYARSIQYSIDVLKASAQEFWTTLINSGAAKAVIDFLTKLLNILTEITEKTNGIPVLGGSIFLAAFGKNPQGTINAIGNVFEKLVGRLELIPSATAEAASGMTGLAGAFAKVKAVATTLLASPVTPWLVGAAVAIGAFALAWDGLTTTVAEAQDDLDKTSSKINDLKTEIQELEELDYRNEEQEKRLDGLKDELEYQEKIYNIERKRILQEQVGKKFSDWFDKDNEFNKLNGINGERDYYNKNSYSSLITDLFTYQNQKSEKENLRNGYESFLKENFDDLNQDEIDEYTRQIGDLDSEIRKLDDDSLITAKDLNNKAKDFKNTIKYYQEAIDDGLLIGTDRENAEEIISEYTEMYQNIMQTIAPILRGEGMFDYSTIVEDTLEESEFEKYKDELIDLAKEGSLTEALLESSFSDLVAVLELAGVKTEELRDYILELAGVTNVPRIAEGLAQKLNIPEYDENGFVLDSDASFKRQAALLEKRLRETFSDEEIALIPKLDVNVDGMDVEPAIRKIREKINQSKQTPIKVEVEFNTSEFKEQDADLEALQSLYGKFRDNVEGNAIKVPLDISDVEELPEKWKNLTSFKEFELKVTTSTDINEVQKAFDGLATEYGREMLKIEGLTKETMDMVKAQLKLDGLEDTGVDKLVDSLAAEEKMNQLVSSLEAAQNAEGGLSDGAIAAADSIYKEAQQLGIADGMLQDYLAEAIKAGNITIDGDLSWLDLLAEKLNMDINLLKELLNLSHSGSGYAINSKGAIQSTYGMPEGWAQQQSEWRTNEKYRNVSPVDTSSAKSAAAGAGKEAADAYVEAYEKEKEQLEKDRDRGLISEREYLDKLKDLIDRFFRDRAQYAERYMDEMRSYMDSLLSHYNSVISGVTTLLDRRISQVQAQKSAVISALQAEKEAALEAYQAQIDALQEEIDRIQDEIDAIDDEIKAKQKEQEKIQKQIDAINDANAARERSINLQKAEYNLQRMMNQRTKLTYTGETGQMR